MNYETMKLGLQVRTEGWCSLLLLLLLLLITIILAVLRTYC